MCRQRNGCDDCLGIWGGNGNIFNEQAMKRIFIAGPYSGPDIITILGNIRRGLEMAVALMELEQAYFCPFLDYQLALVSDKDFPVELYQKISLAWLEVSEAMIVLPGWLDSRGTLEEIKRAKKLEIPIFYSLERLLDWLTR